MMRRLRVPVLLLLAALLPLAAFGADPRKKNVKPAPALVIAKLTWLAGSWRLEKGGRVVDTQWMAPAAGVMLGMGRTLARGKVVAHEFLQIREGPGGALFYVAQSSGQKESAYQLATLSDTEAVFENPEQDFPRKVSYALQPDGSLLAALDGVGPDGQPKREEFSYQRIHP